MWDTIDWENHGQKDEGKKWEFLYCIVLLISSKLVPFNSCNIQLRFDVFMPKSIHKRWRYQGNCTTRVTWRLNHRCLSVMCNSSLLTISPEMSSIPRIRVKIYWQFTQYPTFNGLFLKRCFTRKIKSTYFKYNYMYIYKQHIVHFISRVLVQSKCFKTSRCTFTPLWNTFEWYVVIW